MFLSIEFGRSSMLSERPKRKPPPPRIKTEKVFLLIFIFILVQVFLVYHNLALPVHDCYEGVVGEFLERRAPFRYHRSRVRVDGSTGSFVQIRDADEMPINDNLAHQIWCIFTAYNAYTKPYLWLQLKIGSLGVKLRSESMQVVSRPKIAMGHDEFYGSQFGLRTARLLSRSSTGSTETVL